MKILLNPFKILVLVSIMLTSCVPSRMFEDMKTNKLKCEEENSKLKAEQLELQTKQIESDRVMKEIQQEIKFLRNDTTTLGTGNRRLTVLYNELTSSYEKLVANKMRSGA